MVTQINQFKIINNSNNKGIKFHFAKGYGRNITVNNISIPASGQPSTENYVSNFGGFKQMVSVDFVLFSDGVTDKSTDGANIILLSEQEDYLFEEVIQGVGDGDKQFDISYTVTIWRDGTAKTYQGAVEDISIKGDGGVAGNRLEGSFNLLIGKN